MWAVEIVPSEQLQVSANSDTREDPIAVNEINSAARGDRRRKARPGGAEPAPKNHLATCGIHARDNAAIGHRVHTSFVIERRRNFRNAARFLPQNPRCRDVALAPRLDSREAVLLSRTVLTFHKFRPLCPIDFSVLILVRGLKGILA